MPKFVIKVLAIVGAAGTLFVSASVANADHAWGSYHWARTANPFTLKLGDNVSSTWDSYLVTTSNDWTLSSVLDTLIVPSFKNPKTCRPTAGRGDVCNARYGNNGWLGIASIWASGSHITQGTVRLNDTYFSTASYNTPAWKNLVMCQEVGHIFGLNHQDENFNNANLGTCMDYTSSPDANQHPNQHDYDMLGIIYEHLDSSTTLSASVSSAAASNIDTGNPKEWGRLVHESEDGHAALYERNLGNGEKLFTHVFWVEGDKRSARDER